MDHVTLAKQYFDQGYNCAQAVFMAFAPELGLDVETAARLSQPFGGGMGKQGEVCGAVSAMYMILGLKQGKELPDAAAQQEVYQKVRALSQAFQEAYGTLLCRELLPAAAALGKMEDGSRPCCRYVMAAARILEGGLGEN